MSQPTARGALEERKRTLNQQIRHNTQERDRYQGAVNRYQAIVDKAKAEIDSIEAAIAVLDAAADYTEETA